MMNAEKNKKKQFQEWVNSLDLSTDDRNEVWRLLRVEGIDEATQYAQTHVRKSEKWLKEAVPLTIFGRKGIEESAISQMYEAARLPRAVKAALMPDGHLGYALPIGGVLATDGVVIPNAVGDDIGCSVYLTVTEVIIRKGARGLYELPAPKLLEEALITNTHFGGTPPTFERGHHIMSDKRFDEIKAIKPFKNLAQIQLGTSGGGNHFVEWCVYDDGISEPTLALMSHSGSRGFGSRVAKHYHALAQDTHPEIPQSMQNLAWLEMSRNDGQEYMEAMRLAGMYAVANHEVIHQSVLRHAGVSVHSRFYNWHNFAWEDEIDGSPVIIHRKGATPAKEGMIGVIPTSMTSPAYLVCGLGNPDSLWSASHGAGRLLSRRQAKMSLNMATFHENLKRHGVTLLSDMALDESPMAYKSGDSVIAAQSDCVQVVARIIPKIVRMGGADDN